MQFLQHWKLFTFPFSYRVQFLLSNPNRKVLSKNVLSFHFHSFNRWAPDSWFWPTSTHPGWLGLWNTTASCLPPISSSACHSTFCPSWKHSPPYSQKVIQNISLSFVKRSRHFSLTPSALRSIEKWGRQLSKTNLCAHACTPVVQTVSSVVRPIKIGERGKWWRLSHSKTRLASFDSVSSFVWKKKRRYSDL